MTTIINTPPTENSSDSGLGIVLGVIIGLILIVLFFVYILPTMRGTMPPTPQKSDSIDVNIKLPVGEKPTPAPTTP
ncbi:MAG: hypothetical protein Q7S86_01915 [bacterium]|nr:hypothetical protein [bacterium]